MTDPTDPAIAGVDPVHLVAGTRVRHLSRAEHAEVGRAARLRLPPQVIGRYEPAANRPDPVAILDAQAATRVPELVPIRHGRPGACGRHRGGYSGGFRVRAEGDAARSGCHAAGDGRQSLPGGWAGADDAAPVLPGCRTHRPRPRWAPRPGRGRGAVRDPRQRLLPARAGRHRRSRLAERAERLLGVPATARNWNTVTRLTELVD